MWVRIPVMTLVPLSKALPAMLLVDDTHAYILLDGEGGNPVSAPGVGGNFGQQLKTVKVTGHYW